MSISISAISAARPRDDVCDLLGDSPPPIDAVRHFAHPERYGRAVRTLKAIVFPPRPAGGGFDLLVILHESLPRHFKISRLARAFGFHRKEKTVIAETEIVAGLTMPKQAPAADRALAAVGLVRTAHGDFHALFDCTSESPGHWPARRSARAALLLFLILAAVRGDLPEELALVRP